MREQHFNTLKDLAVQLASDGDFSEEDRQLLLRNVRESGSDLLTDAQREELVALTTQAVEESLGKKVPLGLRIVGALGLAGCALLLVTFAFSAVAFVMDFQNASFELQASMTQRTTLELVLSAASLVLIFTNILLTLVVSLRLLENKRAKAASITNLIVVLMLVEIFLSIMLHGISPELIQLAIFTGVQIALGAYLNPSLSRERKLKDDLMLLDAERRAAQGTLGLDLEGRGYIRLDFFNIFWIFVIGSVIGLVAEAIFHMLFVDPGVYENRAGILYGPFSPIYGVGCVLMTMTLNRFKDKNILFIFVVCTLVGGAFEWLASYWMEIGFGAIAWDYSDQFLGDILGGRTCLLFASMFGAMGTVWIKWMLPFVLKVINMIPWKSRYAVTTVCAVIMLFDCVCTVQALDCWYERVAGKPVVTEVQQFYADHYPNEAMEQRFASMSVYPSPEALEAAEHPQSQLGV
ncbi:MAG: putative ABC transporter permease [Coriobacteriia bacterium]|nr:putative ABC transporter permease [Coriobacteriia bacterium]